MSITLTYIMQFLFKFICFSVFLHIFSLLDAIFFNMFVGV